jgi:hypothetical protein
MSTNKFSKFVIDNIVVGTPISSIVAAGATVSTGLDSADVISLIDSDYVQQRETSGLDSAEVIALIDSDYVAARTPAANGAVGLDSAAALDLFAYGIEEVGANQRQVAISLNTFVDPFDQTVNTDRAFNLNYTSTTGMFIRETSGRTEIHADASGTGQSTGLLLTGASFSNTGTEIIGNVKLSSLPTSDPSETGLLWNDGGIPVFSGSTAPTGGAGLDSAAVEGIVDSAYVQARQTPQDFAYSSLTGAPTALSSFTNDTNYITAADIPATVDSDYVAARVPAVSGGLDSAGVQSIVDDNILGSLSNTGVTIGPGASAASDQLQQVVIGPTASSNGQFNVAIGRNAKVQSSRTSGTAVGNDARVGSSQGGNNGVAIGTNAVVERDAGTAIGPNAYVKNGSNATAVGMQANAWATSALALGHGANATFEDAIAIGRASSSSQADTIAMGTSAVASASRSVAIGNGADATGTSSVALGNSAQALSTNAIAIGLSADTNTNADGIAIGSNTEVKGAQGISIGQNAEASASSVAIGTNSSITTGTETTAVGPFAGGTGSASLALGRGAKANANNTIVLAATGGNSAVATQYGIDIRTSAAGSLTYNTTNDWTFGAGVTMTDLTASGATVIFSNLPTADPLNAGQLWNSAGTLKVSAG